MDAAAPGPDRSTTPLVVGIGLVRRGDRYLVRRRPEGHTMAGCSEFPGGKVEVGETTELATARECLEEVGRAVRIVGLCRTVTHRYPHGLIELWYHHAELVDPEAEPDPASGFAWVAAADLAALTFPPANEAVILDLIRQHSPGPKG